MIKKSLKFSFVDETTRYNSNKLLSALKKRQNLDSDIISATEAQTPSGQIVKLVFVRNRNNGKEFITILCTDTYLTSEKIVELYSRRWAIECYFKSCKQYLGVNKECFGTDFDTVTALNHMLTSDISPLKLLEDFRMLLYVTVRYLETAVMK